MKTSGYGNVIYGHFVKGPIPLGWLERCAGLGLSHLKIGLAIWYLVGMSGSHTVRLTTTARRKLLVSPRWLSKSLKEMKEAGLIRIERMGLGRVPEVTLTVDEYYRDAY